MRSEVDALQGERVVTVSLLGLRASIYHADSALFDGTSAVTAETADVHVLEPPHSTMCRADLNEAIHIRHAQRHGCSSSGSVIAADLLCTAGAG